mgnify:CR=1 FL=1
MTNKNKRQNNNHPAKKSKMSMGHIFSLLSVVLAQSPDFNLTINVSGDGYDYDLIIGFSPVASDKDRKSVV